jgi:hypothetical protein
MDLDLHSHLITCTDVTSTEKRHINKTPPFFYFSSPEEPERVFYMFAFHAFDWWARRRQLPFL